MKQATFHSNATRYLFAICSFGVAFLLTKSLRPVFDTHIYELFQAAVILSAWYGGWGPGILTATVSFFVIDYHFLHPVNEFVFNTTDFLQLLIFEAVAILTSTLAGKLKRANEDLEVAHGQLEERIQKRTQELQEANQELKHEIEERLEAQKAILDISNREQRRLGQDLHDGLSQILTGVRFMTQGLRQDLEEKASPESDRMKIIEGQLSEALTYVDTVSRGLYPVELDVNGLMEALAELAQRMSRIYAVECRFKCRSQISIHDSAAANHLYRIAQEAVMNGIKGGKAKRVNIRLYRRTQEIILKVIDNGVGYGNTPMRKGMGLKMMEYRSRVIGGRLQIRSRRSGATVVTCAYTEGVQNGK